MKISILFVCLGNICRSPAADGILRSLKNNLDFIGEVDSCGTAAYHVGKKPDARMRKVGKEKGFDLDLLSARQLHRSDFSKFDYIVAMDEENLSNIKNIMPQNSKAKVRLLLENFDNPNVPDPYYGVEEGFVECFELIEKGLKLLLVDIKKAIV